MDLPRSMLFVQETDHKIAVKRKLYMELKQRMENEDGLKDLKTDAESAHSAMLNAKLNIAKLESNIATYKEKTEQIQQRLYSGAITSSREVAALESEHAIATKNLAETETDIAPAKATVKEKEELSQTLSKQLKEREEIWQIEREKINQQMDEVKASYIELKEARRSAIKTIPSDILQLYGELMPAKAGIAIVEVVRDVCLGCHIRLPMGEILDSKSSGQLPLCSNCGRILVFT